MLNSGRDCQDDKRSDDYLDILLYLSLRYQTIDRSVIKLKLLCGNLFCWLR